MGNTFLPVDVKLFCFIVLANSCWHGFAPGSPGRGQDRIHGDWGFLIFDLAEVIGV
jgi:hypothetical protein